MARYLLISGALLALAGCDNSSNTEYWCYPGWDELFHPSNPDRASMAVAKCIGNGYSYHATEYTMNLFSGTVLMNDTDVTEVDNSHWTKDNHYQLLSQCVIYNVENFRCDKLEKIDDAQIEIKNGKLVTSAVHVRGPHVTSVQYYVNELYLVLTHSYCDKCQESEQKP